MKTEHLLPWLLCAFLTACGSSGLNPGPKMEVEIVNQSSRSLESTLARFGGYECKWGYVEPVPKPGFFEMA